jgi:hypothetical protein
VSSRPRLQRRGPVAAFVEVEPFGVVLAAGELGHGIGGVGQRTVALPGVTGGGVGAGLHGCFHCDHAGCHDPAGQVSGGLGEVDRLAHLLPR